MMMNEHNLACCDLQNQDREDERRQHRCYLKQKATCSYRLAETGEVESQEAQS